MRGTISKVTPAQRELAAFLKAQRERAGLSQRDVANGLGHATSQAISNWERGVATPSVKALARIGAIIGIPVEVLISAVLRYQTKRHKERRVETVKTLTSLRDAAR